MWVFFLFSSSSFEVKIEYCFDFELTHYYNERVDFSFLKVSVMLVGNDDVAGVGDKNPAIRHWLLNLTILLCGLFLVLIYEASMTSNLVQESFESDFRTAEDLRSCSIRIDKVFIPVGGAVEQFWKSSIVPQQLASK